MEQYRADKFIETFYKVEKWMKETLNANDEVGYSKLLNGLKRENSIIRRYFNELKVYGSLRNLMIIEKTEKNYITYPSNEIVDKFESIYREITKPDLVIPNFQGEVKTFKLSDPLSSILAVIRNDKYTNFPIYDDAGEFVGFLTDNGITNWLSKAVDGDDLIVSTAETTISDVHIIRRATTELCFY